MTAEKPEVMPSGKRPYVAAVLERIELAVNTQNGGGSTPDGGSGSKNGS